MGTLPSGLADSVADDEELARFLPSSSWFNAQGAKPVAFLPHPVDRETSVFRHGAEPANALWQLGRAYAAGVRNLHGVAIFSARVARDANLEVDAAEPPPRHAVLVRWPWDEADLELQKAKQKDIALLLAQRSQVYEP